VPLLYAVPFRLSQLLLASLKLESPIAAADSHSVTPTVNVTPTLKSKMGYKRTTKLVIMHGSHRYGGAQLSTCWDLQGSTHLSMLIGHLQLKDITGQYLLHKMDYLYLHIRFQQRVLSYPITDTQSLAPLDHEHVALSQFPRRYNHQNLH
jgi:hypothetical protein